MIQTIMNLQNKIENVMALIHDDFEPGHLKDEAFVKALTRAVEEGYMLMNEGMCEEMSACQRCSQSRDSMRNMVDLLEDIEAGDPVTASMADEFRQFRTVLKDMQSRIAEVITELQP